jgi:hypothetical protein
MPNLIGIRRLLLAEIGGGGVYTTTAAGSGSTLVCLTFKSSALDPDHLGYAWVMVPSTTAPKQRRVIKDGLTITSGTITVDDVFGGTIGSGIEFEVSSKHPLIDDGVKGLRLSLNQAINLALLHLVIPWRGSFTTAGGSPTIDLSAYAWADRAERVVDVYDPPRTAARPAMKTKRQWEFRASGSSAVIAIQPGYTVSGQVGEVEFMRPAWTWINDADSTAGLVADSDTVVSEASSVVAVAKLFLYQDMTDDPNGGDTYWALYEKQLARCRQLTYWDTTQDRFAPAPSAPAAPAAPAVAP